LNGNWLARRIRYQDKVVVAHIEQSLIATTEDPLWLSAKLMELLQERLGAPKYAALAEKAATLAESADDSCKARVRYIKTRWHLLEKDRKGTYCFDKPETYVKEAEDAQENASKPFSCVTFYAASC